MLSYQTDMVEKPETLLRAAHALMCVNRRPSLREYCVYQVLRDTKYLTAPGLAILDRVGHNWLLSKRWKEINKTAAVLTDRFMQRLPTREINIIIETIHFFYLCFVSDAENKDTRRDITKGRRVRSNYE